jgi:hypothetical protein
MFNLKLSFEVDMDLADNGIILFTANTTDTIVDKASNQ